MSNRVIVKRCSEYGKDIIREKIEESFNLLGGLDKWIEPGMKVVVKPNLLSRKKPDDAVTTHPAVVRAVVELVQDIGAYPLIIDSPGGPESKMHLKTVYKSTGMMEVAEKTGAALNYSIEKKEVKFLGGSQYRKFFVMINILDADLIINLPKLKTHSLTMMTCGVKNLFGVIPGLLKGEYHLTMHSSENFSTFLVDLALFVKPGITIVDGIVGMEGEGPAAGNPKRTGMLITSDNVFNLDFVAAHLIGFSPEQVHTVNDSIKRGLCVSDFKEIDFCGTKKEIVDISYKSPETLKQLDFKDRISGLIPGFLTKRIYDYVRPVVKIDEKACSACRICQKSCPPEAISFSDQTPVIDMKKCIRCYCCQELCPEYAVDIVYPWLGRFLFRRFS